MGWLASNQMACCAAILADSSGRSFGARGPLTNGTGFEAQAGNFLWSQPPKVEPCLSPIPSMPTLAPWVGLTEVWKPRPSSNAYCLHVRPEAKSKQLAKPSLTTTTVRFASRAPPSNHRSCCRQQSARANVGLGAFVCPFGTCKVFEPARSHAHVVRLHSK